MRSLAVSFDALPGQYVLGMQWRHEDKKPARARLKELAAAEGRWGLVRKTADGKFQAGFCEPLDGVAQKPGKLKSLADVIADTNVAPWRAVFDLGDGKFWYLAVADGYEMLPDGDCVCSAQQLEELRAAHDSYFSWREVEGSFEQLAELAAASSGKGALRDFAPQMGDLFRIKRSTAFVLTGLVVLGATGIGVGLYVVQQREAEAQAAARAQAAKRKAELEATHAQAVKPPPLPWALVPGADAVFEACRAAWSGQALAKAGWNLSSWTCSAASGGIDVAAEWVRDGGRAKEAPGTLKGDGEGSSSGRSDPVRWVLQSEQTDQAGADELELLPIDGAQRRAWDLVQKFGVELAMTVPTPPPQVPGAEEAPPPPYVSIATTFVLPFAPWLGFGPSFDDLPGLRVSSIKLDMSADTWTLNGQLYASRKPQVAGG